MRFRRIRLLSLVCLLPLAVALWAGLLRGSDLHAAPRRGSSPAPGLARTMAAVPVFSAAANPLALQAVYVDLNPSATTASVGDAFEVAIRIVAGEQPLDGAEVHIDFARNYLQVIDAQGAPATAIVGGDALDISLLNAADNDAGEIDFAAGRIGSAVNGTVTLAWIRFRALSSTGATSTPLAFVMRGHNPTDVTYRGASVLGGTFDGSVTVTRPGDLLDPLPLACGTTVSDDTAQYDATVHDYGACGSGFTGPEVVYALTLSQSADITLTLSNGNALALFALGSLNPGDCLDMGGIVRLPNRGPGTYHVVVDGLEAGGYSLQAQCSAPATTPTRSPTATQTPTVSSTATFTRTQTPTPTDTPTPTATLMPTSTHTPTEWPTASSPASATPSSTASPTLTPSTTPARSPTTSPTRTSVGTPTSTKSATRPVITRTAHRAYLPVLLRHSSGATPRPSTTPSPVASAAASSTLTGTSAPTGTSVPSLTRTATPSPSGTPAGTLDQPYPAECEGRYEGSTAGHPSAVDSYGSCGAGMIGPEAVYRLWIDQTMDSVAIGFGASGYLRLFLLPDPEPNKCLGSAAPRSYLDMSGVSVGAYYLVVDGSQAADYAITIRCHPLPTAAPDDGNPRRHPARACVHACCQHLPAEP